MNNFNLVFLRTYFETELKKYLDTKHKSPSKLLDRAMKYGILGGGKRLRPLLVFCSALSCDVKTAKEKILKKALNSALAVELAHTYSLVHDDLPCMDDDDFRRNKLSVHTYFDECMGVLVGDALLADSFFILAQASENPANQVKELAQSLGSAGMVAGQVFDMGANLEGAPVDWQKTNQLKTAKLFEACAVLGGLSVGAQKEQILLLREFGDLFGCAFQVRDDLQDNQGLAHKIPESMLQKSLSNYLKYMNKIALKMPKPEFLRQAGEIFGAG